jgi:hypothetical protein
LLQHTLNVVDRLPPPLHELGDDASEHSQGSRDEVAFKNLWNFNLPDAALGWIVLNVNNGHVGAEMKSQGFNFTYRRSISTTASNSSLAHTPYAGSSPALSNSTFPPRNFTSDMCNGLTDLQQPDHGNMSRNPSGGGSDIMDSPISKDDQNSSMSSRRQSSMVN